MSVAQMNNHEKVVEYLLNVMIPIDDDGDGESTET
jgi:hypothetical protein